MAKASHMRKHVREGILVELESAFEAFNSTGMEFRRHFVTPAKATEHLTGEFAEHYRLIAGTPAPSKED
jgi:hypothetical protein